MQVLVIKKSKLQSAAKVWVDDTILVNKNLINDIQNSTSC